MMDTIVLIIDNGHFTIFDHQAFSPSTKGLFEPPYYQLGKRANFKCVQNPTKSELKKGVYKPRLTVTKRMQARSFSITLRIEFSIPKLLYGNNFDEVTDSDFEKIVKKLSMSLKSMSVFVPTHILKNAAVSSVHYSRNIPLTDYSTPFSILKDLQKLDLNRRLDLNQTDFRNNGHCVKYHANSYEVAFYDKMLDMKKAKGSEKRAIEKDYALQLNLFDTKPIRKPFEVLRMEVRLNTRRKIRSVLNKLAQNAVPEFKSLFSETVSQKVLLSYIEEISKHAMFIQNEPKNIEDFIVQFKINNPKSKPRKMLQMLGTIIGCSELGIGVFRESIGVFGHGTWGKIKADFSKYKYPTAITDNILKVKKYLINPTPLKLKEYDCSLMSKTL